ncbi:unnamed protein product, partial [Brassica oleracea]
MLNLFYRISQMDQKEGRDLNSTFSPDRICEKFEVVLFISFLMMTKNPILKQFS